MTEEEKKMEAGLNKTSLTRALLINVIQLTFNQSRNTDAFIMYAPAVVFFFFFFFFFFLVPNRDMAGGVFAMYAALFKVVSFFMCNCT